MAIKTKKKFLVRSRACLLEKRKRQEEEVLKSNKKQKIINEPFSKPVFTITTDKDLDI